jgi:hypothetical protein
VGGSVTLPAVRTTAGPPAMPAGAVTTPGLSAPDAGLDPVGRLLAEVLGVTSGVVDGGPLDPGGGLRMPPPGDVPAGVGPDGGKLTGEEGPGDGVTFVGSGDLLWWVGSGDLLWWVGSGDLLWWVGSGDLLWWVGSGDLLWCEPPP